ncbi:MAG: hydroxymethylbilane synthase, partial [Candidatus Omnitrophica bacterium]|nr:hydroxymethylbilane synthase [Candidatus Omnitrophota bacterium]
VSEDIMLPDAGQGALGLEIRKGDSRIEELVKKLNHLETRFCVEAERSFLARTGAGCRMPVAAFARVKRGRIILEGMIISLDGRKIARESLKGRVVDAKIIGKLLAETVLKNGGKVILREIENGSG